jgi:ubiquinone biosynthesis protein UbiJ
MYRIIATMNVGPEDPPIDSPASPGVAMLGELAWQVRDRALRALYSALEHLLRQQSWARDRLRMHAGRSVRVAFDAAVPGGGAAPEFLATIDSEGLLRVAAPGTAADATLLLKPSADALAALLRDGPQGLSAHLRIEGDVMLAATLGELAQHLRWDAEEDLSRVVGDVAAHRLVRLAEQGFGFLRDLGRRFESTAGQFLGASQGPLAAGRQLGALRSDAAGLDRQLQALEARVARLARGRAGGQAERAGQPERAAQPEPRGLPDNPYSPPPSPRR